MKNIICILLIATSLMFSACGGNKSSQPTMNSDTSKMMGDTADKFNNSNGIQHDSANKPLDSSYNDSIIRKMKAK